METYTGSGLNPLISLIERYRKRLPVAADARIITLGEGNTPLIRLENIPEANDRDIELYVKYEGLNPTGSFKDRGMTMAITQAVSEGSQAVVCASTGNTSASAAAYAARAGIISYVLIPDGKIAMGKLAQAMMHGAIIIQVEGNFDDGMRLVKEVALEAPVNIVNSINPYRLQGQKTAAFEIMDELGNAPDFSLSACRECRQYLRILGRLQRVRRVDHRKSVIFWMGNVRIIWKRLCINCPGCWATRPPARRLFCGAK